LRHTPPLLVFLDTLRAFLVAGAGFSGFQTLRWFSTNHAWAAPLHRRLWLHPDAAAAGSLYLALTVAAFVLNSLWLTRVLRNFAMLTLVRLEKDPSRKKDLEQEKLALPPWPYLREGFTIILGELQARDGARVPSERDPELKPRWLTLPEDAQYTGVFVTGGIGSGKTAAVAYPCLKQMLGFRRPVQVRMPNGRLREEEWKYSGLLLDEKGDFVQAAEAFAADWGREKDILRIGPGGNLVWNVIFNPNLAPWAVGYQLGWIIKNFNRGATISDPFWETAPKELVMDYLALLDDATGYYTLFEYLEVLISDDLQNQLQEKALNRLAHDPIRLLEVERRWRSIQKRRDGMSLNLRGSLESCAKAGIDMFKFPELRKVFCPSRDEYFTGPCCPWPRRVDLDNDQGVIRPQEDHVFTGFDQVLDYGKILGLQMSKVSWFDAATFIQVSLKSQWQDAVLRRGAVDAQGKLIVPPRFGEAIGYCPTFLMADECQTSATPRDNEFKALCRSKRASCWELTQSHNSILEAFAPGKEKAAETYFQNSMTHLYLRQSDLHSMEIIQKEAGTKDIAKTQLAVTEGGRASDLSYVQGGFVNKGLAMSSTRTVTAEEKPFVEIDELKQLPNNVALAFPSTGERTLPATYVFLRPLWVLEAYPALVRETSWLDWPEELRKSYDLDSIPQVCCWDGWGRGPLDASELVSPDRQLAGFIQTGPRASETERQC
jgi:hypothetical protein